MIQLASDSKCTGCTACESICPHAAISMEKDGEGFLFPKIDEEKCVECHLCEKTCPILEVKVNKNFPAPKSYAYWSNLDRTESSSGGAFSGFARLILNSCGSVYGAWMSQDFHLKHLKITTVDELSKLRGSKYVQSDLGDSFKNIKKELREGRKVLFCGTPCEVAGLKAFLKKDYPNLWTLDLVCHGTPSIEVFKSYLKKLHQRVHQDIKGFEFRARKSWGLAPALSGTKLTRLYGIDSLYQEAFDKGAIFRKSCYTCPFATLPRQGDCTIADFWGIGRHGWKFNHSTRKGVSLILTNNQHGSELIEHLGDCFIEERPLEEALIENYNITHSSKSYPLRDELIATFLNPQLSLDDIDGRFHVVNRGLKARLKTMASRLGILDIVKGIITFVLSHK